jgi:hypothetical protein
MSQKISSNIIIVVIRLLDYCSFLVEARERVISLQLCLRASARWGDVLGTLPGPVFKKTRILTVRVTCHQEPGLRGCRDIGGQRKNSSSDGKGSGIRSWEPGGAFPARSLRTGQIRCWMLGQEPGLAQERDVIKRGWALSMPWPALKICGDDIQWDAQAHRKLWLCEQECLVRRSAP